MIAIGGLANLIFFLSYFNETLHANPKARELTASSLNETPGKAGPEEDEKSGLAKILSPVR